MEDKGRPEASSTTENFEAKANKRQVEAKETLDKNLIPKVTLGSHLSEEQI